MTGSVLEFPTDQVARHLVISVYICRRAVERYPADGPQRFTWACTGCDASGSAMDDRTLGVQLAEHMDHCAGGNTAPSAGG